VAGTTRTIDKRNEKNSRIKGGDDMNITWGGYSDTTNRDKNKKMINAMIEGIELTLTEKNVLEWLAEQDTSKVEAIYKIVKKARTAGFNRAVEILSKKRGGERNDTN
jgi:hypothetical protein